MPRKKAISQIEKAIAFLHPELNKRIVCNKLTFIGSVKSKLNEKKLVLMFEAHNKELNERQTILYQPKTGCLQIQMSHGFIFPRNANCERNNSCQTCFTHVRRFYHCERCQR